MKPNLNQTCTLLYAAYAVGALMQFSFWTVIVGSIVLIGAVIAAYMKRKAAAGTPYETHFTWLIRTFWIGGGVYLPVLTLIETAILFRKIDMNAIVNKISAGQISDPMEMQGLLIAQYGEFFRTLTLVFTLPFLAWWLWRCWKGYAALKAGKSVDKAMSWL